MTKQGVRAIISKHMLEVWLSLVERYVRDVEVASSNLVTSTKEKEPSFNSVPFLSFEMMGLRICTEECAKRILRELA